MRKAKITAVDFFDDLGSPYARKWFVGSFIALCVLCAIALVLERSFLEDGVLQDVVDNLVIEVLSGALIVLFFYSLYMHFIGPNLGLSEVTAVRPQDIQERVKGLSEDVRDYIFWGRSGSFFRAYPLLKLDEQARVQKRTIDVEVVLPDPSDRRLINSYKEILTSLGEEEAGNPLLSNVLATSMACAIINENNRYINIRLYYSKFLPAFRIDLSDNGAILTQDDKSKSALYFDSESEFYDMFRSTVKGEMAVSREVKWEKSLFKGKRIEEKSCDKATLGAFGIEIEDYDSLQREVASRLGKPAHRY